MITGLRRIQAAHPDVLVDVRGMGLMIGVEFAVEDYGELSINGMSRRGVVAAYTLNNPKVIRFEPPVIITEEEVDRALKAFEEALIEAAEMLNGM
jgi:putrescine aminotransferase